MGIPPQLLPKETTPEVEVKRPQHNIPTPRSGPSFKSMLDTTPQSQQACWSAWSAAFFVEGFFFGMIWFVAPRETTGNLFN